MRYDFTMFIAKRGMTLIDVLVGTAVVVTVFAGIFSLLRASAILSGTSASKATALAVASARLEELRSLPYDDIGTVGGIPAGDIAQEEVLVRNNIPFTVRTFISYYDDPKDGSGAADSNGIETDYKRAKVTVTYYVSPGVRTVSAVSTFAPPGIETTTGGGTLRVVVVDADGAAVSGAEVSVENPNVSPAIDVTTFTDFAGYALFPGAATSTGYRITVTKSGWSTAKTYAQDATNQNPTPGHLTIAGGQTTTGTFAIDELASVLVRTLSPMEPVTWTDSFADAASVATMSSTAVSGGALQLASSGGYAPSGYAVASTTAPSYLVAWHEASFTPSTPSGTSARVKVVDATGTPIPDAALSGNSSGFTSSPINLSGVSTTTYPSLALRADLSTSATSTTPSIADWSLAYTRGPVPLPSVSYRLTGAKTIGSTVSGTPIYKAVLDHTSNASGESDLDLEWDSYALSVTGYSLIDACQASPMEVLPGATMTESVQLANPSGNSLRVYVKDTLGEGKAGAFVTLTRSGFSRRLPGNECGFVYFGGLAPASDYALSVTYPGGSDSFSGISVSGYTTYDATLD